MVESRSMRKYTDQAARQRAARVDRETARTGFREGRFTDFSAKPYRDYLIEVSFYPKTRWTYREMTFVENPKSSGQRFEMRVSEERKTLTPEFWAKLEPLRL